MPVEAVSIKFDDTAHFEKELKVRCNWYWREGGREGGVHYLRDSCLGWYRVINAANYTMLINFISCSQGILIILAMHCMGSVFG